MKRISNRSLMLLLYYYFADKSKVYNRQENRFSEMIESIELDDLYSAFLVILEISMRLTIKY